MNAPAGCYICSILAVRTCAICAEPTCRQHLMQDLGDWGCVNCVEPVIKARKQARQAEAAERERRLASPESSFEELCDRLRAQPAIEVLWPAKMALIGKRHWWTGEPTQPAGTWTPNSTFGHGWETGAYWRVERREYPAHEGIYIDHQHYPILLMTDGSLLVAEIAYVSGNPPVRRVRLNDNGQPLTAAEVEVSKRMILSLTRF